MAVHSSIGFTMWSSILLAGLAALAGLRTASAERREPEGQMELTDRGFFVAQHDVPTAADDLRDSASDATEEDKDLHASTLESEGSLLEDELLSSRHEHHQRSHQHSSKYSASYGRHEHKRRREGHAHDRGSHSGRDDSLVESAAERDRDAFPSWGHKKRADSAISRAEHLDDPVEAGEEAENTGDSAETSDEAVNDFSSTEGTNEDVQGGDEGDRGGEELEEVGKGQGKGKKEEVLDEEEVAPSDDGPTSKPGEDEAEIAEHTEKDEAAPREDDAKIADQTQEQPSQSEEEAGESDGASSAKSAQGAWSGIFTHNEHDEARPTYAPDCVPNPPVPNSVGSTCKREHMHVCDKKCCCDLGYRPTHEGRCLMCRDDGNNAMAPLEETCDSHIAVPGSSGFWSCNHRHMTKCEMGDECCCKIGYRPNSKKKGCEKCPADEAEEEEIEEEEATFQEKKPSMQDRAQSAGMKAVAMMGGESKEHVAMDTQTRNMYLVAGLFTMGIVAGVVGLGYKMSHSGSGDDEDDDENDVTAEDLRQARQRG